MIKLFVWVLLVSTPNHHPTVFARETAEQCGATRAAVLAGYPPATVAECLRVPVMADQPKPGDMIVPNKVEP